MLRHISRPKASRLSRHTPQLIGAIALALLAGAQSSAAQSSATRSPAEEAPSALTPGDVVRIDGEFVGTVMEINDGDVFAVLGEGEPRCRASEYHGERPICDPAPVVRRVIDWNESRVELELPDTPFMRRTLIGGVIGAAVMAPVGYYTGPLLGYGKIDACVEVSDSRLCSDPIPREDFDRMQKSQDQRRGMFAGILVGATVGAILAKSSVDQWIDVYPPGTSPVGEAWSVEARLPR